MSMEAALKNLETQELKSAQFVAEVDAFVAGVESYTKQAGLTGVEEARLWSRLGDCVELAAAQAEAGVEKQAQESTSPSVPGATGNWFQRFLGTLRDPQGLGMTLRSAVPGVLGGLLTSLLFRNQRGHWLRNAMIGGGLGALAYPTFRAFATRPNPAVAQ